MAHTKCYAICESKCKVETLSKETLDYRYSQTDNRLMKISSNISVIMNDLETLKSDVAKISSEFYNFYITDFSDLAYKVNSIEKRVEALENA